MLTFSSSLLQCETGLQDYECILCQKRFSCYIACSSHALQLPMGAFAVTTDSLPVHLLPVHAHCKSGRAHPLSKSICC